MGSHTASLMPEVLTQEPRWQPGDKRWGGNAALTTVWAGVELRPPPCIQWLAPLAFDLLTLDIQQVLVTETRQPGTREQV